MKQKPEDEMSLLVLPVLGRRTIMAHQRVLSCLLVVALLALLLQGAYAVMTANKVAKQVTATGQALMQSQRLAKSAAQALGGSAPSFAEMRESAAVLTQMVQGLRNGDQSLKLQALDASFKADMQTIYTLTERTRSAATSVVGYEEVLTQMNQALRSINRQSFDLLEVAENIVALKLKRGDPPLEISAAGQLAMLTQRIGKSANEFLSPGGVSPEAVFLLGKDMAAFKEIALGFLDGSDRLRLRATTDPRVRSQLEALLNLYAQTRQEASAILDNLQGLLAARETQVSIVADSEPLRRALERLQGKLSERSELKAGRVAALVSSGLFTLLFAFGLAYIQVADGRMQHARTETRRQEAKRVLEVNEAAILRLMDELQVVAEGDLTKEATVSGDITGAIADSVNSTVEELRNLVGNVYRIATRVVETTTQVDHTSSELIHTSQQQLSEIHATGQTIVDMAQRINHISVQARESAEVARDSLRAAQSGFDAVQKTMGGMNAIREQMQQTSKRIKRLGESSQEIGEMTELIANITEQTNVLALNAAIQAAAAGQAGRGFSVVAQEVQRLAERSADATRQIADLVRLIQTDTQDAVAAVEQSTLGVVQGAALSDRAGGALSEIDSVSNRLADLIEQISAVTSQEAASASVVAGSIQNIFTVTEEMGHSTHTTAEKIRVLASMAQELRESVARFKIV